MTTIQTKDLSCYFPAMVADAKGVLAVDHLTMTIEPGKTLVLLGPSGCGKTTLLRMLAGLEAPTSGQVLYDQQPLHTVAVEKRRIGMVFQNYALIPNWEARRTIGFFLRLRRRENEVPDHVRQVSQITGVGIEHLLDRFPNQLSGGEKQRVAIARAFARDLDVLFFDEPFANLDAKFRATARVELRRLLDAFNVTSIIVTHDQQEAAALSDQVAVMDNGRIIQQDTYLNLLHQPVNIFVARFVGTPTNNFFEGKVSSGLWQGAEFGDIPVPKTIHNGALVTIGVAPQHFILSSTDKDGAIPATVIQTQAYYAERYQLIDVASRDEVWQIQTALNAFPCSTGDTVYCQIAPETPQLYFDTLSGERIPV